MKQAITIIAALLLTTLATAQVAINQTGDTAHPSAALEIDWPNRGLLIPRTTTDQIDNPTAGLLIFDTNEEALALYDGDTWRRLVAANPIQEPRTVWIKMAIPGEPWDLEKGDTIQIWTEKGNPVITIK